MSLFNLVSTMQECMVTLPRMARLVGNASLSIGFAALCRELRSPTGSEIAEVAVQTATSAAEWYALACHSAGTDPWNCPQTMEGLIEFLLTTEGRKVALPKEVLEFLGVTPEEIERAKIAAVEERRSWLTRHRASMEARWEGLVAGGDGALGYAATTIAARVLSKLPSTRTRLLQWALQGAPWAVSELTALKLIETDLFAAWKAAGGRDQELPF